MHRVATLILLFSGAMLIERSPVDAAEATTARVAREFTELDRDEDGRLSLTEFLAYRTVRPDNKKLAMRDFQLFDQDEDQRLSLGEFSTLPMVVPAAKRGPLPDPLRALADQSVMAMDQSFDGWDEKPDLSVPVSSFVRSFSLTLGTSSRPNSIEADPNRDGRVTRDEARRFMEIQVGVRNADGRLLRQPNGRVCNVVRFRQLDTDKNNLLDQDEFTQQASDAKAVATFEKNDLNKDKKISFDEWCRISGQGLIDPVNEFCQMDANLDARVDPKELLEGTSKWKQAMAAHVFPGFDLDEDGALSLTEYRLTMQANPLVAWNRKVRDENGDGKMSFAEFKFDTTQHPLLRWFYFQTLDINGDGMLDDREFTFKVRIPDEFFYLNEDGTGWRSFFRPDNIPECGSPKMSHDGKLLAFDGWSINPRSASTMFILNLEKGTTRRLRAGMMPVWSKDGKMLTFSSRGVQLINADGTGETTIAEHGWGAQWSPDGRKIAFNEGLCIKTYDVATQTIETVLDTHSHPYTRFYWNMAWSADSSRLCFKGMLPNGTNELATISMIGEEPELKVHYSTKDSIYAGFAWHPRGDRIVFAMNCRERSHMQLYELNPNKDDPPRLVVGQDPTRSNTDVCWTIDGKRLIVVSGGY